jgi:hypothetical protein
MTATEKIAFNLSADLHRRDKKYNSGKLEEIYVIMVRCQLRETYWCQEKASENVQSSISHYLLVHILYKPIHM